MNILFGQGLRHTLQVKKTLFHKHMTKCVCDNGLLDVNVTLIGFVITVLLSFREYFLYAAEFTNYT